MTAAAKKPRNPPDEQFQRGAHGSYLVEVWGKRQTLMEWAKELGRHESSLRARLRRMPAELALLIPERTRVDLSHRAGEPGSWTWDVLPYAEDEWARRFVREHPDGGTLEEVAQAMGMTRERVRQVEADAFSKLARAMRRHR